MLLCAVHERECSTQQRSLPESHTLCCCCTRIAFTETDRPQNMAQTRLGCLQCGQASVVRVKISAVAGGEWFLPQCLDRLQRARIRQVQVASSVKGWTVRLKTSVLAGGEGLLQQALDRRRLHRRMAPPPP